MSRKRLGGGVFLMSLLSTLLPYSIINIPPLGIFIGTTKFACFPILQYSPLFLMGMFCQSKNMFYDKRIWAIAIICTVTVTLYSLLYHQIPKRFPPSLGWILWSLAFTMLYYLLSEKMSRLKMYAPIKMAFVVFGAYTLDYLVISNVLIFAARYYYGNLFTGFQCTIFIIILFKICFLYGYYKSSLIKYIKCATDTKS